MTKTKWIAVLAVVAVALIAWRWMDHRPSEAADAEATDGAAAATPAAVVHVERHNVGGTLTIAGEFKGRLPGITPVQKVAEVSRRLV